MSSQPRYADLAYEDRIVAFVDILGWRNAVSGPDPKDARELGWVVHLMQNLVSQASAQRRIFSDLPAGLSQGIAFKAEVSQFSDSVVISIPATGNEQGLLEQYLSMLTSFASQNGFLVRGGIARGELYHRDGLLYGPAFIAAYDLEQKAKVPRIILEDDLEAQFLKGSELFDGKINFGYRKAWRRDADGRLFFDYMQPLGAIYYTDVALEAWRPNIHQLENYKHLICKGLVDGLRRDDVMQKYIWARDYYTGVLMEYPGLHVAPVGLKVDGQLYVFEKHEWPIELVADF